MPGNDDRVAKVKAALASPDLAPEKRATLEKWLKAKTAELPAEKVEALGVEAPAVRGTLPKPQPVPEEEPIQGFDYAQYKPPATGGELIGAPEAQHVSLRERVHEIKARAADDNPELPSESKRRSLYAEPLYEGKNGIGMFKNAPFVHYEPKPEHLIAELTSYSSQLQGTQKKDIEVAIADLKNNGKDSKTYKEAADRIWVETRSEFEREGLPVQRVAHAPVNSYRTGVNKVAGTIAAPILHGADQSALFGGLSAAWPTMSQDVMSGSSPEQDKVVERLRQRGVLPAGEAARGQDAGEGGLSLFGGIMGLIAGGPKSLGGGAVKAGLKTEAAMAKAAPAWLRGTTLGSRLTRSAAGGAVAGGLAGGGTQAVTELSEAARGGTPELGDVAAEAGEGALFGTIADAGGTTVAHGFGTAARKIGQAAQEGLRMKPGLGDDLRAMEAGGAGKTDLLFGVKQSPEGKSLAREALEPVELEGVRMSQTKQQAALKPIADAALESRVSKTKLEMERMQQDNVQGYARLEGRRASTYPVVNQLMSLLRSRKDIPFTEMTKYKEALLRTAEVQPMLKTDPAAAQRARLTPEEAASYGLDYDAIVQDGFKRNINGVTGKSRENIVLTLKPKTLSAQQLDDATQGLGNMIKWGKDAGSKDRELRRLYESLVDTRKQFGEVWASVKKRHDETFQKQSEEMEALGFSSKDDVKEVGDAERAQAYSAFQSFGQKGTAPSKNAALIKLLRDNPELKKRLELHAGNEGFERLSGQAGDVDLGGGGAMRKAARAVRSGMSLRADPLFGMMRSVGSKVEGLDKNAVLRQKVQEMVGPGVDVDPSMLAFVAQVLNVVGQTAGEEK